MSTAPAESATAKSPRALNRPWRDEMNFCEYPLSVLGDRAPAGVTELTYEIASEAEGGREENRSLSIIPASDEQLQAIVRAACPYLFPEEKAEAAGRRRAQTRTRGRPPAPPQITAAQEAKRKSLLAGIRGVPTANDDDVILALIELTRRKSNFAADGRQVHFSLYEMVKLLGWNESGRSYARLVVSLLRWKAVTLAYVNAWRDNGEKKYLSKTFNILADVTIFWGESAGRRRATQGSLPFSSFTWDETVYKSFRDGFLKKLDFTTYSSLRSMVAKRMYRFLDKHFHLAERYLRREPTVSFDLRDFARGHIGLLGDYEPWKIKQKLAAGIHELEQRQIIEPMPDADRYLRQRHGEWRIVFKKGSFEALCADPDGADPCGSSAEPPAPTGELAALTRELVERGVSEATARTFTREFPAARIAAKLEYLDFLVAKGESPARPAGWLVDAIRKDYAPPAGFEPKAVRDEKRQDAEQRRRKKHDDLASSRRREEAEAAARRAERAHVDGYLAGLTPAERKALEDQAVERADPKMRESARGHDALAAVTRRVLVDREVLRVCPLPSPGP